MIRVFGWKGEVSEAYDFASNANSCASGDVGKAIGMLVIEFVVCLAVRIVFGYLSNVETQRATDVVQALVIAIVNGIVAFAVPSVNGWSTVTVVNYLMVLVNIALSRCCPSMVSPATAAAKTDPKAQECQRERERLGIWGAKKPSCSVVLLFTLYTVALLGVQFAASICVSAILIESFGEDKLVEAVPKDNADNARWIGARTASMTLIWLILFASHASILDMLHTREQVSKDVYRETLVLLDKAKDRPTMSQSSDGLKVIETTRIRAKRAFEESIIANKGRKWYADCVYICFFTMLIFGEELAFGPRIGFGFDFFGPLSVAITTSTGYIARLYALWWLLGSLAALAAYAVLYLPVKWIVTRCARREAAQSAADMAAEIVFKGLAPPSSVTSASGFRM